MRIAVVGAGWVGLVQAICLNRFGVHEITVFDVDHAKISALRSGILPISEPSLTLPRAEEERPIVFTDEPADLQSFAPEVVILAVGTPAGTAGAADLSQVWSAVEMIRKSVPLRTPIVVRSTCPPGTNEKIAWCLTPGAYNDPSAPLWPVITVPEFLREGQAVLDFAQPDRVVIGCRDPADEATARALFTFGCGPVIVCTPEEAELIKLASNALLAARISAINELSALCETIPGCSIERVSGAIGADRRIGRQFLEAGAGYGGSCFPKDTLALGHFAAGRGLSLDFVRAAIAGNETQIRRLGDRVIDGEHSRIAFLGLTFKPGTNDLRESPALRLLDRVAARGATWKQLDERRVVCSAYDPALTLEDHARLHATMAHRAGGPPPSFYLTALDAARGADAVVIATGWPEFMAAGFLARLVEVMAPNPTLYDFRNLHTAEDARAAGFVGYIGVGRRPEKWGAPSPAPLVEPAAEVEHHNV